MSDSEKRARAKSMVKDAGIALLSAGTAAGLAGAGGAGTGLAALSGGAAVLPWALTTVIAIARGWKEREAARWWYELLHGHGNDDATPEEIAGIIDEHGEKPFVRETILRGVRAIGDAVDPAVVTPLATLARDYVRTERDPDGFFRGTARLLADLSAQELADLRELLAWISAGSARDEVTVTASDTEQIGKNQWRDIPWRIRFLRDEFVGVKTDNPDPYVTMVGIADPVRLFHLLRLNGLGMEGHGMSYDAGPGKIVLVRSVIDRLRTVLGNG
jgi:hypothetical protein